MRLKRSEYMHWAKTQSRARFNLATSGVGAFPMEGLPFDCGKLEINGDNSYGYSPLKNAIAAHAGVSPDCVVPAVGTSFANYLAMATLLDPGDEVLIEHPAYGLLVEVALNLGADVRRFARPEESGFALDPSEIRRAITPKTRLIAITNLHNPSSALATDAALRETIDIASSVNATVLVDEVYRDAVYENTPPSAFHLGSNVVVTSSLTKVYGLSGLRCGWIVAQPEVAGAMFALNNLFGSTPVHPGELMSVAAFENLSAIRERSRKIVEADRVLLRAFLASQSRLSAFRTEFGTTSFVRLKNGGVDAFLARLRDRYETSAVPGRFFEMPDHIRIGMGVDTEMFAEGLRRTGLTLAE